MRWSARSATAERFRDNGKVIFFLPSDLCVLICVGTGIRLRQFGGKLKETVGGVVRSSPESLRIAVDLPWCMLLVSLVCLFFQWSVRRTCGFDGAFRWTGRPTNDRAPQVYIHPPPSLKNSIKTSSRFAKEIHSVSSRLLALVTETSDSQSSACEQLPVCSTTLLN